MQGKRQPSTLRFHSFCCFDFVEVGLPRFQHYFRYVKIPCAAIYTPRRLSFLHFYNSTRSDIYRPSTSAFYGGKSEEKKTDQSDKLYLYITSHFFKQYLMTSYLFLQ